MVAGFRALGILAGSLSLSGMQCKAAKTTSNYCSGLSRKISEQFRCYTNTCSLFFLKGLLIGLVIFSSLSTTKLLCCCIPVVMTELTEVMAAAFTMTLESRVKRHSPSSSNGFPSFLKRKTSLNVSLEGLLQCRALLMAVCGPAVTHRLNAPVVLASPTALPSPLTIALHCSCAWSRAMVEKGHFLHNKSTIAKGLIQ